MRKTDPGRGDTLFIEDLLYKGTGYMFVSTKDCCVRTLRLRRALCRMEVG